MKILLTGGLGQVGSYLCERLSDSNEVIILDNFSNNINGTLNLLEAARKSDIGRFIYISSAAVYGDPITLPVNEEHPANPLSPYALSIFSAPGRIQKKLKSIYFDTIAYGQEEHR